MSNGCCKPTKNPCMVCQRTVTTKNGLQCQGSCGAWIHFTCCSYTPGKVKDIKAKIIKVRCPCPDCTPPVKKEELMRDEPFSCPTRKDGQSVCNPTPVKCKRKDCIYNSSGMPQATPAGNDSQDCDKSDSGATTPMPVPIPRSPSPSTRYSPAPSALNEPVMPSISVVENMCETVGLLSTQLNQLMGKMTTALNPSSNQNNPGSPCYCPRNPRR